MEMTVRDDTKMVEIYLTKAEENDQALRAKLQKIYDNYKEKKYLVAVFESGDGDLYQDMLDLLAFNKKRMAQKEVERKKAANAAKPSVLEKLRADPAERSPGKKTKRVEPEL